MKAGHQSAQTTTGLRPAVSDLNRSAKKMSGYPINRWLVIIIAAAALIYSATCLVDLSVIVHGLRREEGFVIQFLGAERSPFFYGTFHGVLLIFSVWIFFRAILKKKSERADPAATAQRP
jgi:hypothetical protein